MRFDNLRRPRMFLWVCNGLSMEDDILPIPSGAGRNYLEVLRNESRNSNKYPIYLVYKGSMLKERQIDVLRRLQYEEEFRNIFAVDYDAFFARIRDGEGKGLLSKSQYAKLDQHINSLCQEVIAGDTQFMGALIDLMRLILVYRCDAILHEAFKQVYGSIEKSTLLGNARSGVMSIDFDVRVPSDVEVFDVNTTLKGLVFSSNYCESFVAEVSNAIQHVLMSAVGDGKLYFGNHQELQKLFLLISQSVRAVSGEYVRTAKRRNSLLSEVADLSLQKNPLDAIFGSGCDAGFSSKSGGGSTTGDVPLHSHAAEYIGSLSDVLQRNAGMQDNIARYMIFEILKRIQNSLSFSAETSLMAVDKERHFAFEKGLEKALDCIGNHTLHALEGSALLGGVQMFAECTVFGYAEFLRSSVPGYGEAENSELAKIIAEAGKSFEDKCGVEVGYDKTWDPASALLNAASDAGTMLQYTRYEFSKESLVVLQNVKSARDGDPSQSFFANSAESVAQRSYAL